MSGAASEPGLRIFLFCPLQKQREITTTRSGQQNGALSDEATKTATRKKQIYVFKNI